MLAQRRSHLSRLWRILWAHEILERMSHQKLKIKQILYFPSIGDRASVRSEMHGYTGDVFLCNEKAMMSYPCPSLSLSVMVCWVCRFRIDDCPCRMPQRQGDSSSGGTDNTPAPPPSQPSPPSSESPEPPPAISLPQYEFFQYQWHLKNTGQVGAPGSTLYGTAGVDLNVLPVWKQGIGGKGITVAVLDDGLDIGHEVFEGNIAEGLSVNYFSPDKSNPTPTHPGDFHGTAMAGIIAAAINGKGGVGVAPKVKVAGLKIFDQDRAVLLTDQQDALSRGAANGSIDISNNSWGAEIDGTVGGVYQDAVVRAATRYGADHGRYGKGIVDLFAAGNDCEGPTCALPGYGWTNFDLMRHPQLLAIPAIDDNGKHPDYY